nr:hypothetical protein [Tanacetum cinerariifolium]
MGHFARECKALRNQDRGRRVTYRHGSKAEEQAPKALMAIDKVGWDWSYMENEEEDHALVAKAPTEFALMANTSTKNKASDSQSKSKTDEKETPKKPPVKDAEQYRKPNKKPNIRGNQRNWNNLKSHQLVPDFVMKKKACFNCGDFNHLAYECRKRVKGDTTRSQNNTYKSPSQRPVIPRPNKSPVRSIRPNMNCACSNRTSFNKSAHSYTNRHFQRKLAVRSQNRAPWVPTVNRNFSPVNRKFSTGSRNFPTANKKFFTASRKFPAGSTKGPTVDMGMKGKAVKPLACWSWKPSQNLSNKGPKNNSVSVMFKKYTYIDTQGRLNGCSRHMTGNISYLSDFEPFDGGYMSFRQGGCKITGKGTIKTECIVLGREFKMLDDANILLRTPRQHNMYSINLNNIVSHRDLTCLVAKAAADECYLWHRRLSHLNFKTMNKLVRYNLVRGLPTKCFENDHNCTAGLKGKQHKASCKSKLVTSVSKPLHTLHMDLFGPTSVSSISHKWYCLVVTDDFSRFTWTFFLKTKDETSRILRKFITKIENLKDLKVKIIRCDNGGEFRNKELNDFCSQKGIKREFSNARTPQQNGVAERRNRTPAIGFLKPFGCHVMILNTLDNLGTNSTNFLGTKVDARKDVKKDVTSLRYIVLPNWVHEEYLESISSQPQDPCNTDAPESSGNSNLTDTSTNPLADQVETLTAETPIPNVSSPVPTVFFTDSQERSSETRLISKKTDVKGAFLYGTIDEEVYVMQPPGFQDPDFLAK